MPQKAQTGVLRQFLAAPVPCSSLHTLPTYAHALHHGQKSCLSLHSHLTQHSTAGLVTGIAAVAKLPHITSQGPWWRLGAGGKAGGSHAPGSS